MNETVKMPSAALKTFNRFILPALLLSFLLAGCSSVNVADKKPTSTPPPASPGANVVFLLVDALRADRFTPEIMPHMTAFAEKNAVRFDAAVSQAPWTAPSVASIFTSLYTEKHGVKTPRVEGVDVSLAILSDQFETLAESLQSAGYSTAAFIPNDWLTTGLGFSQGFDVYEEFDFKKRAPVMNKEALLWVKSLSGDKPFFLYIHYMDAHGPYNPPPGYAEKFAARHESQIISEEQHASLGYLASGPYQNERARDLKYYRAAYDGGAAYVDEQLQAFLDDLAKISPREKTIIVFVADHGEAFFEHGHPDHGHTLFDEEIIVPFFIALPSGPKAAPTAGRVIKEQVELIDIFPTIAALTGAPLPSYNISGISLAQLLTDPSATLPERTAWSSNYIRGPRRAAARTQNFKIIQEFDQSSVTYVFDLVFDPGETDNLDVRTYHPDQSPMVSMHNSLNKKAAEIQNTGPKNTTTPNQKTLDPEAVKRLKQLNYLE